MSKRGLNIYHRKDGRYEGRYACGFYESGKTKYASVYGKTFSEVKEKLLSIKARRDIPDSNQNLTVKKLFGEWLAAKSVQTKASTYANYLFKAEKHILPAFGHLKIDKLSPSVVYHFIAQKQKVGLSNKYISDLIAVLKSAVKYAAKNYHAPNNISEIELPKKKKKELDLLTKGEQNRLCEALLCDMDFSKLAIFTAKYTGIRIGELCGLKWSDIDFSLGTLRIERTVQRIRRSETNAKTAVMESLPKSSSSIRTIPLPKFLLDKLKAFEPSDSDYYIITESEKPSEPRTVQYRFKAILKKAGIRDINFHALRHMFATNCIELGFDVKTLSEILGHSSVEITLNRYVHSSINRKKQCMDMLKLEAA